MSELLALDRFFVNQTAKLVELNTEFNILDEDGNHVGTIRQEGQSTARKILRALTKVDQFLSHTLTIYDASGAKVIEMTRPGALVKSRFQVRDSTGVDVGTIAQRNVIGKIKFSLTSADGKDIGTLDAENWRAWNFSMKDASGAEVGRITKKWAGAAKELFTSADNYMVELQPTVRDDARTLMFAAAAGIDLALKQSG